jgi:hypothetical protein
MKIYTSSVLILFSLLVLCSCLDYRRVKSQKEDGEINQNETVQLNGSNVNGSYAGEIWPVNYNLHFKKIGLVGVQREGDSFSAMVTLKYGPKETRVKQAIYTARRCPNINDDLNKDAYIDILEARLAIGKITIPFDGDLDSQMAGNTQYPFVDRTGKMFYSRTASFSRLFEDLKTLDENPLDQIIKLGEEEGITLPGRIVLFQGMPRKVFLPESVATTDGEDKYETIPVGCSVLWKVKNLPEELKASQK